MTAPWYPTKGGGYLVMPRDTIDHLLAHPDSEEFFEEAAALITLPTDKSFLKIHVDLGRIIGKAGCLECPRVGLNDVITCAFRKGRPKPSRVILNTEGPDTSFFTIFAYAHNRYPNEYRIVTGYIGTVAPFEPTDKALKHGSKEEQEAMEFWSTHALVYEPKIMGPPFLTTWARVLELAHNMHKDPL